MLAKDLRRLGRLLIPLAVIGWGAFPLLFSGHLDSVPAPVWWLAVVFLGAVGLTALVALRFRARARQKDRW
jgi:hypothetical protein